LVAFRFKRLSTLDSSVLVQYVYARETRRVHQNNKDYIVIVMHSVLNHNIPEISGVIRVDDYHQSLALELWNNKGTKGIAVY